MDATRYLAQTGLDLAITEPASADARRRRFWPRLGGWMGA